jgi:hypothetical protein
VCVSVLCDMPMQYELAMPFPLLDISQNLLTQLIFTLSLNSTPLCPLYLQYHVTKFGYLLQRLLSIVWHDVVAVKNILGDVR